MRNLLLNLFGDEPQPPPATPRASASAKRKPVAPSFAPVFAASPAKPSVWSVSEFTQRVKDLLERTFAIATVRGEISNLKQQASGHIYFTLKDAGSQLAAVLFRGNALRARCALRDGLQVVATGEVSVYAPRGNYQLIVREIEEDGAGRLQREFEELKQRLAAEGLFDKALKRPLPTPARCVGVVTSPTGAALQDFLRILRRRDWRGRVVVFPVRVQGTEAAGEVAAMLKLANALGIFDLLVVTRGGGSLEDLWPFNEERVARAVRASAVPVLSAVGHEIDFTLCDFAADVRAETPSAAAEMISSAWLDCLERCANAGDALTRRAETFLETTSRHLAFVQARLAARSPERFVESAWLRLDDLRNRLLAAPRLAVGVARRHLAAAEARLATRSPQAAALLAHARLAALDARLKTALDRQRERATARIETLGNRLQAAGVDSTLRRGFALVLDPNNKLIPTAKTATPQKTLRLRFTDGEVEVRPVPAENAV